MNILRTKDRKSISVDKFSNHEWILVHDWLYHQRMINREIMPGITKPPRPLYKQLCVCMCVCTYNTIPPSERRGLYPLSGKFRRLDRVLASEQNVVIIQKFWIWSQLLKSVEDFTGYYNNVMILPKLEKYFGNIGKWYKVDITGDKVIPPAWGKRPFLSEQFLNGNFCQHSYYFPNFILLCRHLPPLPQRYQTL